MNSDKEKGPLGPLRLSTIIIWRACLRINAICCLFPLGVDVYSIKPL